MEYHELANLFPMISPTEASELAADIAANGLREPIVTYEGKILDGRNRFEACKKSGVEPVFVEYTGDDPLSFVVSLNLKRRHLSESQRGMVGARIANLPAHRPDNSANLQTYSRAEAAQLLNVSERTVNTAKKVEQNAAPELIKAVDSGAVSVSAAADVAELPKEQQAEIVAKGEREILEAAKRIRAVKAKEPAEKSRVCIECGKEVPKGKYLCRGLCGRYWRLRSGSGQRRRRPGKRSGLRR